MSNIDKYFNNKKVFGEKKIICKTNKTEIIIVDSSMLFYIAESCVNVLY